MTFPRLSQYGHRMEFLSKLKQKISTGMIKLLKFNQLTLVFNIQMQCFTVSLPSIWCFNPKQNKSSFSISVNLKIWTSTLNQTKISTKFNYQHFISEGWIVQRVTFLTLKLTTAYLLVQQRQGRIQWQSIVKNVIKHVRLVKDPGTINALLATMQLWINSEWLIHLQISVFVTQGTLRLWMGLWYVWNVQNWLRIVWNARIQHSVKCV